MARTTKQGLDYFPLDCDFLSDEKVISVKVNYGAKGVAVLIALLCAIFRQGYFVKWNEGTALKVADDLPGVSYDLVGKVVEVLVKFGFFDKSLFDSDAVLTSAAIQRRYFEATQRRKRQCSLSYILINVDNNPINVDNNPINVDRNATNKSKVNKIKDKPCEGLSSARASATQAPPHQEQVLDFSIEEIKAIAMMPDVLAMFPAEADIRNFHAFYSARGWMVAPGIPMRSVKDAFIAWLNRRESFSKDSKNASREAERRRKQREQADEAGNSLQPEEALKGDALKQKLAKYGY